MSNADNFSKLLTLAVRKIKVNTSKPIGVVQDELGFACDKEGSSYINYLRQKHLPSTIEDLEILTQELVRQGGITKEQLKEFLTAGGHPNPEIAIHPPRLDGPQRVEHFNGRQSEIDELLSTLQPGRVLTIYGPGGVGKSALVAEVIHRLAPNGQIPAQFPHGLFYHDFYRQSSVDATIEQIARFFEEELKPTPYHAARRALFEKQALLVFDGAEEADNLNKVLEIRGRSGVLLVTRDSLAIQGKAILVDLLPSKHAINTLQSWSSHKKQDIAGFQVWSNDQATNWKIAEQVCELVGWLPLALRLAGNYMLRCKTKAPEYLQILQETSLATLQGVEPRQHESIPILLEKSLEKVSENARKVMAIVGLLSYNSFSVDVVANALDIPKHLTIIYINELIRFGMVNWLPGEHYQVVHRLLHTYARKHLSALNEVIERLVVYYIALAKGANQSGLIDYQKLDTERMHILAILIILVGHGKWEYVQELAQAIDKYLDYRGYWSERITINEYGRKAAQKLKNRQEEANWLNKLGSACGNLGFLQQAADYFQQALVIQQESHNHFAKAVILINLGSIYAALEQPHQAIDYLQQALRINEKIGSVDTQSTILMNLGNIRCMLGQYQLAVDSYQQALTIREKIGDREGTASLLGNLGIIYSGLGDYQHAINYIQQALEIFQKAGNRPREGQILGTLGPLYMALGQHPQAIECYQQALTISREINYPGQIALNLSNLGIAYAALGYPEKAIHYYKDALKLVPNDVLLFKKLADAYLDLEQLEQAVSFYEQYIESCPDNAFHAYVNLGVIAQYKGNELESQKCFEEALSLSRVYDPKNVESIAQFLADKALVLLCTGQEELGISLMEDALAQRLPKEMISVTRYKLLAKALNPPGGLDKMSRLMEETIKNKK